MTRARTNSASAAIPSTVQRQRDGVAVTVRHATPARAGRPDASDMAVAYPALWPPRTDARPAAAQPIPRAGGRGARGRRYRRAASAPRRRRPRAGALERRSWPGARGPRTVERRGRPGRGSRRHPRSRCRSRSRPQHPSALRLAGASGGARGGRADGAAPAQLQAVLCDRDRLPRRRALLSVPWSQDAAWPATSVPRLGVGGGGLRSRAQSAAAGAV